VCEDINRRSVVEHASARGVIVLRCRLSTLPPSAFLMSGASGGLPLFEHLFLSGSAEVQALGRRTDRLVPFKPCIMPQAMSCSLCIMALRKTMFWLVGSSAMLPQSCTVDPELRRCLRFTF
jgi:hypothetical protein